MQNQFEYVAKINVNVKKKVKQKEKSLDRDEYVKNCMWLRANLDRFFVCCCSEYEQWLFIMVSIAKFLNIRYNFVQ